MTGTPTMQVGQFGRPTLSKDGRTLTVHIPITLRHQGGRKQVVTPEDATPWIPIATRVDNTMVKALARAHRWRDMLVNSQSASRAAFPTQQGTVLASHGVREWPAASRPGWLR